MNSSQFPLVAISLIRRCKQRKFTFKAGDLSGQSCTGGQLLMRALILRRLLSRELPREEFEQLGILIPPSVGGLLINLACTLDRRIPVNLNYTLSEEVLNHCVKETEIKRVFTSRKVLDKLPFRPDVELVFLEDWIEKVTLADKIGGVFESYAMPSESIIRKLKLDKIKPDDLQTIIFTSGTTGLPKGVMLSQNNIASNVEAINNLLHLDSTDTVAGILPFFHSFGYTLTMWAPMALDLAGVYHFTPLAARQVGRLVKQFKATMLLSTPTFLRNYQRRVSAEDFASLRVVISGAERLAEELKGAFREKFGATVVEGYGTTELSPMVSGNIPAALSSNSNVSLGDRPTSVGRPPKGIHAKVTDIVSGEELPTGEAGMLWISGPNVMMGYLNQPEKTRECIVDGWYETGDIAAIDKDGFIFIKGRQKRFSKIGGEMVPQVHIEEKLLEVMSVDGEAVSGEQVAVTSIEDEKKGEALVVLHTAVDQTPEEMVRALRELGLPLIFIPQEANFFEVESIPVLGSGKLDLGSIQKLANELAANRLLR